MSQTRILTVPAFVRAIPILISPACMLVAATMVIAALAGCQDRATLVDALPPPNLNGPDVLRPTPVAIIPPIAPLAPFAPVISRSLRGTPAAWVPIAAARPWKWIVIHHSDTPTGSAAEFDKMHREKGWDELGYHFVIGNGTGSGDGQVEVGPRWPIQKHGAHTKSLDNRFNEYGIGICLVGNFMEQHPTPAQLRSLAKLVAYLQATYHIPSDCILRHRDCKPTLCPGTNLNIDMVRQMAGHMLVDAGVEIPKSTETASATTQPSDIQADNQGSVADLLIDTSAVH